MKRWVVCLAMGAVCSAVAWVTGCATVSTSEPSRAEQANLRADALARYSEGLRREWKGEPAESFSNFLRAAELDPDNEEVHFRVAAGFLQQDRAPEAVDLLRKLARRRPQSEQAQLWLALACQAAGQPETALEAYDRARKISPKSSLSYLQKAELFVRLKRFEDAATTLEAGLSKVDRPLDLYRALAPLEQGRARVEQAAGQVAKRLPKAVKHFENAVAAYPQELDLQEVLGRLYIMSGDIARAVATFEPLEKQWSGDPRRCQQLAIAFLLAPDRGATLQALDGLAEARPDYAPVLYYLGTVLEQSNLPAEAAEAYRRAITARPDWSPPYLRRVVLQVAAEEPEEAILTLEDGLQFQTNEVRFLELLAYIQLGRKDFPEAKAAFARADKALEELGKKPVSANYYLSQAFVHQVTRDYGSAARCLLKAVAIHPDYLTAYVHYTLRSNRTNNLEGCAAVLEEMARTDKEKAVTLAHLGLLRNYEKSYAKAIETFEQAELAARKQEDEESILTPTFYFWFASACERNGDFDRAADLFKRVLATKPDRADTSDFHSYVDALNYLAYMWAERGLELEQGLTYINEALTYRPDNPAFLDTRGWIYFKKGQWAEARADIERALELRAGDPTINDHMGDLEFAVGRTDEAITYWKTAFQLEPENDAIARKLTEQGVDLAPLREQAAEAAPGEASGEADEMLPDFGLDGESEIELPAEAELPIP